MISFKNILQKSILGLIFGIGFGVGFIFIIKAGWTSTSPGTTDSNMFISGTGTLTKDKWNALVQKSKRQDVPNNTIDFDTSCQRRLIWTTGLTMSADYVDATQLIVYADSGVREVLSSNKIAFNRKIGGTLQKIQKLCF